MSGVTRRARKTVGRPSAKLSRALKSRLLGRSFTPAADPPKFTQLPWNTITLSITQDMKTGALSKDFKATDIYNSWSSQTGLSPTGAMFSFRILTIAAWAIPKNDSDFVSLSFQCNDLTIGFGAQDYLVQLEDTSGKNHFARCGFKYPDSQSLVAVSGNDTENIFGVSTSIPANVIIHLRLLWKPRVKDLPNFHERLKLLECAFSSMSTDT